MKDEVRTHVVSRGEKYSEQKEGSVSYPYIFLSYRRTIYIREWVIIKMIEDSIFGFNTCHYFDRSFYLFFRDIWLSTNVET